MNKTKSKRLIKLIQQIEVLVGVVENEINFENLLSYIYDYTGITIRELEKRYHIND